MKTPVSETSVTIILDGAPMLFITRAGQRAAFAASTVLHLTDSLFRRSDQAGDVYPDDEPSGVVQGQLTESVMVMGERGEMSLGVVTHHLSMGGFLARARHRRTLCGVRWSVTPFVGDRLRHGPRAVKTVAEPLAAADHVVIMVGITDSLRLETAGSWERDLCRLLDDVLALVQPTATIVIAEIPPLANAGSLTKAARIVAGQRSTALNDATRRVSANYQRVTLAPFPVELTRRLWVPQSIEERYTATYAAWSRSLESLLPPAPPR